MKIYKIKRQLKNHLVVKSLKKIPESETYKKAFSHFYIEKSKINSNLKQAAFAFEQVYNETSQNGTLIIDLKILEQKGVEVKVKKGDGTKYQALNLATNSYNDLDLETKPRMDLVHYVANEPLSSCLSRKIAGELPIHRDLENEIKDFLGMESAVLATSGYIAQQAIMFALFKGDDIIFSDEHNHASLIDGMKLSQAKVIVYPHLDYVKLEELIKKHRYHYNCAGIVSDGVFSAHGTIANLDIIHELKKKYNLISIIDDTHGFATIGENKRGILDLYKNAPDILSTSLAKGLAGFGGAICGSSALIKTIDCMGRQNINTSHLSPLVAAQSLYNLKFLRNNLDNIKHELNEKILHFNFELARFGINQYQDPLRYSHPIFSYCAQTEELAIAACQRLLEEGFVAAFFPPPVAPRPTLRFSLHRLVTKDELTRLAQLLSELKLTPIGKEFWAKIQVEKQAIKFHLLSDNSNISTINRISVH